MSIKKVSSRTENTFELIATYFVKDFYIKLYDKALSMRNMGTSVSVTDGYIKLLGMYVQSYKDMNTYKILFNSLVSDIIEWSNTYLNMRYVDCIDKIVIEFMPEDYIESTTNNQKQMIIRDVLINFVNNAVGRVVDNISYVIDNRNEDDCIDLLRDEFIALLYLERDKIMKRFVLAETYDGKISNNQINIKMLEDFKKHIKDLVEEKVTIKKQLEKMNVVKEKLLNKIIELENKINELNEITIHLKSDNKQLKDQLENNNKIVETYKNTLNKNDDKEDNLNALLPINLNILGENGGDNNKDDNDSPYFNKLLSNY